MGIKKKIKTRRKYEPKQCLRQRHRLIEIENYRIKHFLGRCNNTSEWYIENIEYLYSLHEYHYVHC